jgi:hypothetical protein
VVVVIGVYVPDEALRPYAEEVAACQGLHTDRAINGAIDVIRAVMNPEYTAPRYWVDLLGNVRRTPGMRPIIRKGLRA